MPVSGLAGLIFAIHPLHTEVVNLLVGRAELLAFAGVMGTLVLFQLARIFHEVGRPWVFHFGNPWYTLKINQTAGNGGAFRVFSGFCQSSETPSPSPIFCQRARDSTQ
ncbi:MAG: hypothetical protein K1Y36_08355 [Blastocatellia bacterium]|nr:hypothetical protein [Blastocatellia bacterium]